MTQNISICAPSHNFIRQYLHNEGIYRQSKKKLLNRNISSTCPHNMVDVRPLTAEIGLPVWGTPANFNGFRVLASLLQRRRSSEANQTLHDVSPSPGLIHYVAYTFSEALARNGILPGAKFTLRPSLALSYMCSVTARPRVVGVSQTFGFQQRAPPILGRAAIALGIGPHSSFVFFPALFVHSFVQSLVPFKHQKIAYKCVTRTVRYAFP